MYRCKICGLDYEQEKIARECERFCKEHNACSIEITKHALNKEKGGQIIR